MHKRGTVADSRYAFCPSKQLKISSDFLLGQLATHYDELIMPEGRK